MHQKPDIERVDSPVLDRDREVPAKYKGINSSRKSGERPSSGMHRNRGMAGPIMSSLDVSTCYITLHCCDIAYFDICINWIEIQVRNSF